MLEGVFRNRFEGVCVAGEGGGVAGREAGRGVTVKWIKEVTVGLSRNCF